MDRISEPTSFAVGGTSGMCHYPSVLKGGAILFKARIIAVVDMVEAMMSRRPVRPAFGLDAALAEIEKGRGRPCDPAAVDSYVKPLRTGGIALD